MKISISFNKITSLVLASTACASASAATFDLSGDYRFGTNMYQNLDTVNGSIDGATNNLNFWEHRFRLNPDVLIDQHFKFKSQIIFAGSSATTFNNVSDQFGAPFDATLGSQDGSVGLLVQHAYLEWASDWGLLRAGRVPKAWGLGALYRQPDPFLSDFSSMSDRVDFKAMLGNLGLTLGFEKIHEGRLRRDSDDSETYILSMDYSNPESGLASGVLYERNVTGATSPISRNSSHDLSIFAKKTWGTFSLGAEYAMLSEEDGDPRSGLLFQLNKEGSGLRFGADFAVATASGNDSFEFHPNYRPLLILFRQTLGQNADPDDVRGSGGTSQVGGDVTGLGGGGAYLGKAHLAHQFKASAFQIGAQVGWAQLAKASSTGEKALGLEVDLTLMQKWYDNFKVYYAGGMLFPGKAWDNNPKLVWGLELKGVVEF